MSDYLADLRDVQFLLFEYLDVEKLLNYPKFQEFNKEMFEMIVEESLKQAQEIAGPLGPLGDEKGVRFEDGKVPRNSSTPTSSTPKQAGSLAPPIPNGAGRGCRWLWEPR